MSEIEELVQRAVDTITMIAGKASSFATKLLVVVAVICTGGFLLGAAALSGGAQQVWIVLGMVFGAIAVGGAILARWRVGSVKRHVPELADEVRSLISDGTSTGKTVIESFVVDTDGNGRSAGYNSGSAIVLSRQMYGFRGLVGSGMESSARLTAAVTALTSFPLLVLAAIGITLVFSFMGVIFLIILAL
jgi:hypothetical protein